MRYTCVDAADHSTNRRARSYTSSRGIEFANERANPMHQI
jgi:hypothetical protein